MTFGQTTLLKLERLQGGSSPETAQVAARTGQFLTALGASPKPRPGLDCLDVRQVDAQPADVVGRHKSVMYPTVDRSLGAVPSSGELLNAEHPSRRTLCSWTREWCWSSERQLSCHRAASLILSEVLGSEGPGGPASLLLGGRVLPKSRSGKKLSLWSRL